MNQVWVCSWSFSPAYVKKKEKEKMEEPWKKKRNTCCCCSALLFIFLLKMDVVLRWTGWKGKSAWNSGRQLTVSECQMKSFSFLSRGGEVCHQHSWLWFCQRGWRRETDCVFFPAEGKSTVLEGSSVPERLRRRARPSKCRKLPLNPGMSECVCGGGAVGTNNTHARADAQRAMAAPDHISRFRTSLLN